MNELHGRITLAVDWLLSDGIHIRADPALGAFREGYDIKLHRGLPAYTEITGYGISLLVAIDRLLQLPDVRQAACEAAVFIERVQIQSENVRERGGVIERIDDGQPLPKLWAFDAAMCGVGLLNLYTLEKKEDYRIAAEALGNWLTDVMQQKDGSFRAAYDLAHHVFINDPLFGTGSCIHAKNALFLLRLAALTDSDCYTAAALRVCDYSLLLQEGDGFFWAMPERSLVFTHACCYALEGLIYAYHRSAQERYLTAFRRGVSWLLRVQLPNGGLRQVYNRQRGLLRRVNDYLRPFTVTDATAQAVRLWLIAYSIDRQPVYLDAARRAVEFLCRTQCLDSGDRFADGGFYYGSIGGKKSQFMYSWCTQFTIAAMLIFSRVLEAESLNSTDLLDLLLF